VPFQGVFGGNTVKRFNLTDSEKAAKIAQHIHTGFPTVVGVVVLKGLCNLRCRMCPVHNVRFDRPEFMDRDTFDRVMEEIPDNGDTHVELTAMGEPLLHKDIRYFIRKLGECYRKNSTLLVTNGHYLSEELIDLILEARIDRLQVSLNAYGRENYRWFTGSSAYDQAVANLERLIEKKVKAGSGVPYITTHIAGIREFEADFAGFLGQWEGKVELARIREVKDWSGITRGNGITPLLSEEIDCERYPCSWLWESLEIYPSGDLYTCSFQPFFPTPPLGNVTTQSITEIWQGKALWRLREKHLTGRAADIDFCEHCTNWYLYPNFWDRCEGGAQAEREVRWCLPELGKSGTEDDQKTLCVACG
jgi:radical SAM protein with 4Fe4S-binding SPASM domain